MARAANRKAAGGGRVAETPQFFEELPIRRIAARFIARNEEEGLAEIDRITSEIYEEIRPRYIVLDIAFFASVCIFILSLAISALAVPLFHQRSVTFVSFGFISISGIVTLFVPFYWRKEQYNLGRVLRPQAPVVTNGTNSAIENLEKFFKLLQSETTPRSYYLKRDGTSKILDETYYFGRFRLLLLSKYYWVREAVFAPHGLWFSAEIFMKANVEDLIQRANAKPSKRQNSDAHDYKALLLLIIEHPTLKRITPGKHGDIGVLIKLIKSLSDADGDEEDVNFDQRTPEKSQMYEFAGDIMAAIEKNRTLPIDRL